VLGQAEGGSGGTVDRWRPMASSGHRLRRNPVGVSTGSELLICGHRETPSGPLLSEPIDGAAYDPVADTWRSIAPSSWIGRPATAVWTGEQMIVLGVDGGGAAYDPAGDSWRTLPAEVTTPAGIREARWTGDRVLGFGWSAAPPRPPALLRPGMGRRTGRPDGTRCQLFEQFRRRTELAGSEPARHRREHGHGTHARAAGRHRADAARRRGAG
jgi:hypothetical protein